MGDTSRNSLDWQRTYCGVVPCADCAGIITTLTLGRDETYTLQTSYRGKDEQVFTRKGRFTWNDTGNRIALEDLPSGEGPLLYKVGENRLIQLDREGNEIAGSLASMYVLKKNADAISNKYWKLVEVNGTPVVPSDGWKREPHIIFHADGKRVSGHGGCNAFSGKYELMENNRIRFAPMAATKMFCTGISDVENMFFDALGKSDSYYVRDDSMQLNRARMAPLAKFVAVYLR